MNLSTIRKVYPPYQTDQFQKCPTLWKLCKRWSQKPGGSTSKRDEAAVLGTAIALGLRVHYQRLMAGSEVESRDPLETAQTALRANYRDTFSKSLKGMLALVQRGIELGCATDLGLKRIYDVERSVGNITPDLVGANHEDALVVVDHKVKVEMDDRWLDRELAGYDVANQFFHYAWAVGMEYGEPVVEVRAHLIVLSPVPKTFIHPVTIEEKHLAFWLQGVAETWNHMKDVEDGLQPEARFASCLGRYGPCEMYDACHVYHGDDSLMPVSYTRNSYAR